MIRYYKLENNRLVPAKDFKNEEVIWCDMVDPTDDELINISEEYEINLDDMEDCLDENERPRYNFDVVRKNNFLLLRAIKNFEMDTSKGPTFPFGLFLTHDGVVISIYATMMPTMENLFDNIARGKMENGWFLMMEIMHFLFIQMDQLSQKIAKTIREMQPRMLESQRVSDIKKPFELNNYLIFFTTATMGNSTTLKSFYTRYKTVFDANSNLFEKYDDVQTDIDQTHSFSDIYRDVMSNLLEAFGSVINNNVTQVMKVATSVSIIISIPTLIASLYGMNVHLPGGVEPGFSFTFYVILFLSFGISYGVWKIFRKLNWL